MARVTSQPAKRSAALMCGPSRNHDTGEMARCTRCGWSVIPIHGPIANHAIRANKARGSPGTLQVDHRPQRPVDEPPVPALLVPGAVEPVGVCREPVHERVGRSPGGLGGELALGMTFHDAASDGHDAVDTLGVGHRSPFDLLNASASKELGEAPVLASPVTLRLAVSVEEQMGAPGAMLS